MRDGDRRAAIALTAAIVLAVLAMLGVRALAGAVPAPTSRGTAAMLDAAFTLLLFGVLATVAVLAMSHGGGLRERAGAPSGRLLGIGLAAGFGGFGAAYLLAMVAGTSVPGAGPASIGLVALGTLVVLVQAAGEELYFRGWLLGSLERAWGAWPALGVSAIAFAALHLLGGARAPLSLANLLLGGLLFGLLAQRTRGLLVPIAAHWAWNWAEGILFGLDPNPGSGSFGALWDHDLVGAAAWGGSSEGLNASLAVTASLVAILIPLAAWPQPARAFSRSGLRG